MQLSHNRSEPLTELGILVNTIRYSDWYADVSFQRVQKVRMNKDDTRPPSTLTYVAAAAVNRRQERYGFCWESKARKAPAKVLFPLRSTQLPRLRTSRTEFWISSRSSGVFSLHRGQPKASPATATLSRRMPHYLHTAGEGSL